MKPTVLVFDLDDTLYSEREFVLSGFAAVDAWLAQRHGLAGFGAEATRLFEAGTRGRIFDEALRRLAVDGAGELVPHLVDVYRGHAPRISLLEEARWALQHFHGRLRLGLITDGHAATQRNKFAALGVSRYFAHVVFTDDLGRANWKPSPLPFRDVMDRLGCAGDECVYVGDNPVKDFVAPNALGWLTVQIRRGNGEYGTVDTGALAPCHRPHLTIQSLYELESLLP